MKKTLFVLLLVALGSLLIVLPSAAVQGPALNQTQIQMLKTLELPIVVPYYLPPGFQVSKVEVSNEPSSGPIGGKGYVIEYGWVRGNQTYLFQIQAVDGGIGDSIGDHSFSLKNATFGEIYVHRFDVGGSLEGVKFPFYQTAWIGDGPLYYAFNTGNGRIDSPFATIDQAELVKIIQSLGYLK